MGLVVTTPSAPEFRAPEIFSAQFAATFPGGVFRVGLVSPAGYAERTLDAQGTWELYLRLLERGDNEAALFLLARVGFAPRRAVAPVEERTAPPDAAPVGETGWRPRVVK